MSLTTKKKFTYYLLLFYPIFFVKLTQQLRRYMILTNKASVFKNGQFKTFQTAFFIRSQGRVVYMTLQVKKNHDVFIYFCKIDFLWNWNLTCGWLRCTAVQHDSGNWGCLKGPDSNIQSLAFLTPQQVNSVWIRFQAVIDR